MKGTLVTAMTVLGLGGMAFSGGTAPRQASSVSKSESPFACVPAALEPRERKRHFDELGPALRKLRTGVRELPDGYEFEFPAKVSTYRLLSEWAFQERSCCPFFAIDLELEREGGPIWLRLTGREGVKEFIREEFPPVWFAP